MKKLYRFMGISLLSFGLMACQMTQEKPIVEQENRLTVINTTFASYDWVKEVLGDNPAHIDNRLLSDNGVDIHSYQPSSKDIATIQEADLLIHIGGESEFWMEDILQGAKENLREVDLMKVLGEDVFREERKEGMQVHDHDEHEAHEYHDHDDHQQNEDDHHHEDRLAPYDEHVWLSLRNAQRYVKRIADELASLDPANKDLYIQNANHYNEKLIAADRNMEEIVAQASVNTLLFGDRFPFRYWVEDYQLDYYAAFMGCSAETEASFETIAFLADKLDELNLRHIYVIESSDQKIARSIRENTATNDQEIIVLDSLQSVTREKIEAGLSYLAIMEKNIEILRQTLAK